MKQTLSIAVLALIGQSATIDLDRQVTADDFDGMGETVPVHSVAQVSYDETLQEQAEKEDAQAKENQQIAAIEQQKKADAERAKQEAKFNPFDGLVHEDDGSLREKGTGKVVGGVNKFTQQSLVQNTMKGDEDVDKESTQNPNEPDAFALKKARDKKDKEDAAELNPFDGTIHNKDGTRSFPVDNGGGIVGGVNKFTQVKSHHKHKHHKKHNKKQIEEDSQAELDQKAKDNAAVKAQAESNEKAIAESEAAAAKKAKAEADFKEKYSATDGLLHNKDGTKQDPTDGRTISGANNLAQDKSEHSETHHNKHHVHAKHHHKQAKKEKLTEEMEKRQHDAKGFAQWLEKDEPESNSAVQHHKHHKGHHQKGAHHKKIHHKHEAKKHEGGAPHSLHQVEKDKEQHKHHEKKHAKKHESKHGKKAHHHKKEPVTLQMNATKMAETNSTANVTKNITLSSNLTANITSNSTSNSSQNATAAIKQAAKE